MKIEVDKDMISVHYHYSRKLVLTGGDKYAMQSYLYIVDCINDGSPASLFLASCNDYSDGFVLAAIQAYNLTVSSTYPDCYCRDYDINRIRDIPVDEFGQSKAIKQASGKTIKQAVLNWLVEHGEDE